jgi:hypothetical protein
MHQLFSGQFTLGYGSSVNGDYASGQPLDSSKKKSRPKGRLCEIKEAAYLRRRRIRNAEAPITPRAIVLGSGTVVKLKLCNPTGPEGRSTGVAGIVVELGAPPKPVRFAEGDSPLGSPAARAAA